MMQIELKCHICGHITDFHCRDCDEPVCEDCCVPFTMHNQIDFALCTCCHDGNQAREHLRRCKENEIQDAKDEKRKQKNKEARRRYWKPENVAKRKERKEARKKAKMELREKQLADTINIVSKIFRGF